MTSAQERALGCAHMFYLVFHYLYTHPHAWRTSRPEVPGEGSLFYDLFVVSKAFFFQKRLRLDLVCRAFRAHIRGMPHARRLAAQVERWKNEPLPFYAGMLSEMEDHHVGAFVSRIFQKYTDAFETAVFREGTCEGMTCMNPGCAREAYGDDGPAKVPFCAECAPFYMHPISFRMQLDGQNGEELALPDDPGCLTFWLNADDGAIPDRAQRYARYRRVAWRLQQPYLTVSYLARVFAGMGGGRSDATARRLTDAHRGGVDRLLGQLFGPYTQA